MRFLASWNRYNTNSLIHLGRKQKMGIVTKEDLYISPESAEGRGGIVWVHFSVARVVLTSLYREVLKVRIVNLEVEADVDAPSCRPTTPLSLELGKVKHKSLLFTLSFFSHLFFFLYLLLSFGIAPLLLSWSFVWTLSLFWHLQLTWARGVDYPKEIYTRLSWHFV